MLSRPYSLSDQRGQLEPPEATDVVDLTEVLRRSVEQATGGSAGRTEGTRTGSRRPARGTRAGGTRRGQGRTGRPKADALSSLSKDQLYQRATKARVPGRSKMNRDQLIAALRRGAAAWAGMPAPVWFRPCWLRGRGQHTAQTGVDMTRPIREVMTPDPVTVEPMTSLERAAAAMRERDVGDVLVAYDCDLFGVLTDRDIVVRALADGLDPHTTTVGDLCTRPPLATVGPEDTTGHAAELMREHAVRRLPVVERGGCPVGMVTLGDLAAGDDPQSALADISRARPNR